LNARETVKVLDAPVTVAEMRDDWTWFDRHPNRRYRLRLGWVVRRHGSASLWTRLADDRCYLDDDERLVETLWWRAAWPDLDPQTR
jgi:hypothetical protein